MSSNNHEAIPGDRNETDFLPTMEKRPLLPGWFRTVAPVLVSIGILYYYFYDENFVDILNACKKASLWIAIPAIVLPQLVEWFTGTLLVERHFRWFHGPFSLRDYFWVRGAMYILMFVNPALGGGGLLLYQQRKAQITWRKIMGIALFRIGLALFGMAVIMIPLTLLVYHYELDQKIQLNLYVWWGFLIFGVVYLINSWMTWHHGTHFGISKIVVRDRNSEFWTAFRTASKGKWFITWGLIIPPWLLTVFGFYLLNLAFGIEVPLLEFMVVGPLAMAVMALPIAAGGFGTATMAWMIFFGEYGTEQEIAALTLFLPFGRSALRAVIGLICLQPALKDINGLALAPDERTARLN